MSTNTRISWTDATWNVVTGCTPISEGCRNCYAKRMARRLAGRCGYPDGDGFAVTVHPKRLREPVDWRKHRRVFVCSMSDLFHEDVPFGFIDRVFGTICECRGRHNFQILTKRPARMLEWFEHAKREHSGWFSPTTGLLDLWETWIGVTIEDQQRADERIPLLMRVPVRRRFVSCEPLLGPIRLPFDNISALPDDPGDWCPPPRFGMWKRINDFEQELHWVIVGGESGPGARPMHPDWARSLRDQCAAAEVPFFFKQQFEGGERVETLDGREHKEFPEATR